MGREIRRGLAASATVSYESHPRDLRDEKAAGGPRGPDRDAGAEPAWGVVAHPGWSSPCSPDLPNLHYEPVVAELAHLIEAKAVSLAPSDPLSPHDPDPDPHPGEADAPTPDPVAVELLRRPASMGLRDYLSRLAAVGMLDPEPLASEFVARYEDARYSGEGLDEGGFRALMGFFAEILRAMRPLDASVVDELRAEMEAAWSSEGDLGDDAGSRDAESVNTTETVQRTRWPETDAASSSSSSSSTGSRGGSHDTAHTAPSRPAAARTTSSRSGRSAQRRSVRRPSWSSFGRVGTDASSGYSAGSRAGSVIRLKEARGPLDLPYAIITGDGEEA